MARYQTDEFSDFHNAPLVCKVQQTRKMNKTNHTIWKNGVNFVTFEWNLWGTLVSRPWRPLYISPMGAFYDKGNFPSIGRRSAPITPTQNLVCTIML